MTVTDSMIADNDSEGRGGGAEVDRSRLILTGSTISGNEAGLGGGIWSRFTDAVIEACLVADNTAGGGLFWEAGNLTLEHVEVSGNTSGSHGGGVSCTGQTTATIRSATIPVWTGTVSSGSGEVAPVNQLATMPMGRSLSA